MIRVCSMQVRSGTWGGGQTIADQFQAHGNVLYMRDRVSMPPEPVRLTIEIEVSPEGADLLSRVTAESIALGCGLEGLAKVLDEARWVAK